MSDKLDVLSNTDNIEQRIGKVGFQSGMLELFTKISKAGKDLLGDIMLQAKEKAEEKEALLMQYIEILKEEARILNSVLKEMGHGKGNEDAEYQAAALISQQLAKSAVQSASKLGEKEHLAQELSDITKEIEQHEQRYKNYEENISKAEQFIEKLPPNRDESIKALKEELARLEGTPEERQKQADEVYLLVEQGKEQEARALLESQNAKNTQIGALKDMLAVAEGSKKMYNLNGNEVTSFNEAQFIVPESQRLVKEKSTYYLLNKDEALTDANKEQAAQNFERRHNELSSVRSLINANQSKEMMGLGSAIDSIKQRIEALPQAQEHAQTQAQQGHNLGVLPDTIPHKLSAINNSTVLKSTNSRASESPIDISTEVETEHRIN